MSDDNPPSQNAARLSIFAAVSLRRALREIAGAPGMPAADMVFGFSGALRERILAGEPADIFLSSDRAIAQSLLPEGDGASVVVFAHNGLAAVARRDVGLTQRNLLERLLDPKVRLGICMPGRDAAGDAALRLFARAELLHPGAGAALAARALILFARPDQAAVITGPEPAMRALSVGEADIILIFASWARNLVGVMDVVAPPDELAVPLENGLVVLTRDPARRAQCERFVAGLLAPDAQEILRRNGLGPPATSA